MRYQRLSFSEREQIALGLAAKKSLSNIAQSLGRHRSTLSREIKRGVRQGELRYVASHAHRQSARRAKRPKTRKLAKHGVLRWMVQTRLVKRWSPQQISVSLRKMSDNPERNVSAETIYQSLYVQGRGTLRKELHRALRRGRAHRRSQKAARSGKIRDMVMISERPAEVADRAVPGLWVERARGLREHVCQGDLIIGKGNLSQVGTLVERTSRYVMLVHLPRDRQAHTVAAAIKKRMAHLPKELRKTLTWDQGREMSMHMWLAKTTGLKIYFCDPHSPWQRGSNENTNGLLRQYLPKNEDLSRHSQTELNRIARELNTRPRETLDWMTSAEYFHSRVALAA